MGVALRTCSSWSSASYVHEAVAVGVGERGLQVAAGEIGPDEGNVRTVGEHRGDAACRRIVADGGLPLRRDGVIAPYQAISRRAAVGVPVADDCVFACDAN